MSDVRLLRALQAADFVGHRARLRVEARVGGRREGQVALGREDDETAGDDGAKCGEQKEDAEGSAGHDGVSGIRGGPFARQLACSRWLHQVRQSAGEARQERHRKIQQCE